jgi:hypothetical protein
VIRGVTQRVEGWPHGECVRASYASILGLDIDDVPAFDPATSAALGKEQGDREREWLASIGLNLVEIATDPNESLAPEVLGCIPEVPHLMSGLSPRGFYHRCVGIGGKLAWDPHPSRAGLLTVYSVGILVPLDEEEQEVDR